MSRYRVSVAVVCGAVAGCSGGDGASGAAAGAGAGAAAGAGAGAAAGAGGAAGAAGAAGAGAEAGGGGGCDLGPDPWPDGAFVTSVVSFTPGPGGDYGQSAMPCVVYGPPHGVGTAMGSLDVVSLGLGGELVLGFSPRVIVDGPGPDFIVFENPFLVSGDPNVPFAEPGEISVSDDGTTWFAFPCTSADWKGQECAGVHPVYAGPESGTSPFDPAVSGGDAFDLAELGLTRARFVKIVDRGNVKTPPSAGFDLDAIAIVNAAPDTP